MSVITGDWRRLAIALSCTAAGLVAPVAPAHAAESEGAAPQRGNRIEVTGNSSGTVRVECARTPGAGSAGRVNINSVDVNRRALDGETVIISGRNTPNQRVVVNCDEGAAPSANVNVNSVTIR